MKLRPVNINELPQRSRSGRIIQEFVDSNLDAAEVMEYEGNKKTLGLILRNEIFKQNLDKTIGVVTGEDSRTYLYKRDKKK